MGSSKLDGCMLSSAVEESESGSDSVVSVEVPTLPVRGSG